MPFFFVLTKVAEYILKRALLDSRIPIEQLLSLLDQIPRDVIR